MPATLSHNTYSIRLTLLLFCTLIGCGTEDTEAPDDGEDCPSIYQPVCADGTTYDNECVAQNDGVTDFVEGACDD